MRWWRPAALACAALLALAPLPAALVERWYSNGAYPFAQAALTRVSNAFSFALLDALLLSVAAWLLWRTAADVRERRGGWLRIILRATSRVVTGAAVLYLVFLACWGLNYRRVPLRDRLVFDDGRISSRRARDLAIAAVDRANMLYDAAHQVDREVFEPRPLELAFAEAERELRVAHPAMPARPKRSLLDFYFRLAGVDGMTDPYFLETLVVSGLFPFERPFIVAHEWGHLAGFADESEASFVGWLACLHGPPAAQYSGWLFLYTELAGGLRRADAIQVGTHLANGPRADLRAVADRVSRQRSATVSNAGWRVYDEYLKANRVEAGTASYAEVVKLVLGTTFGDDWTPQLRN